MYRSGLGLSVVGEFENHDGFDGAMLGFPDGCYHFEFTHNCSYPVQPQPTPEDLVVIYLPARDEWQKGCAAMLRAGFTEVTPFNPYWERRGRTFEDRDGYRIVLQQQLWLAGS